MIPADESHASSSDGHSHIDVNGPPSAMAPVSNQNTVDEAAGGRIHSADNAPTAISDDGATTPGGPVMVTTLVVVGGLIVWWRRRRHRRRLDL